MSAARDVALALGGRRVQRLTDGFYLVPCPVPSHGKGLGDRNPSLRLGDGASRLLVRCFAGCDVHDILDVLRRRGLLVENSQNGARRDHRPLAAQDAERRKREDDDAHKRIRWAREICNAARDPRGTLAESYLRSRGLVLDGNLAGKVLRFHPRCPWRSESGERVFLSALIAVFRSIASNEITAVHRIRLDEPERWPKAERKMLGVVGGAAVKLDADVGNELAIGEGIETCMAARQLGIRPTWALGSAGAITHFPVLPNIRTLRLIGENDCINEAAVEQCGLRWQTAGRCVRVIRPTDDCNDLNDVLGGCAP